MVSKRKKWPEPGEFIIGTVVEVQNHGAYVILEEYGDKEGLVHISEIASSWVRNIRHFIKEKQKVVLKVIKVDTIKRHINLSLRRVNQSQRNEKRKEWKRDQKAEGLLRLAVQTVNNDKTLKDAYNEVGWLIEDLYGDIYSGFETIRKEKIKDLTEIGISEIWAKPILEIINQYVDIPNVSISGELRIKTLAPNGVQIVKDALNKALDLNDEKKLINIKIISIGAPKYKIDLTAPNYKIAESILDKAIDLVIETIESNNGFAEFIRY